MLLTLYLTLGFLRRGKVYCYGSNDDDISSYYTKLRQYFTPGYAATPQYCITQTDTQKGRCWYYIHVLEGLSVDGSVRRQFGATYDGSYYTLAGREQWGVWL